jgi:hypothetical protein
MERERYNIPYYGRQQGSNIVGGYEDDRWSRP